MHPKMNTYNQLAQNSYFKNRAGSKAHTTTLNQYHGQSQKRGIGHSNKLG
jgi:hypothetical protein